MNEDDEGAKPAGTTMVPRDRAPTNSWGPGVTEAAAGAGAAAVAALAATNSPTVAALVAGLGALGAPVGRAIATWFTTGRQRRAEKLLDGVAHQWGTDPATAQRRLTDDAEKPHVADAILRAARAALEEAVDGDVVPTIGALLADYASRDEKPDQFFRGLLRVLVELSEDELSTLASWAAVVSAYGTRTGASAVVIVAPPPASLPYFGRPRTLADVAHTMDWDVVEHPHNSEPLPGAQHSRRLVHLLSVHEVAPATRESDGGHGGPTVELEMSVARRLDRLLNGEREEQREQ